MDTAQAQTTSWEAAFYVELSAAPYAAEIRLLNQNGQVTNIALPTNLSRGAGTSSYRQVIISDDRRYVVLSEFQEDSGIAFPLRIADLQNGTCCLEVSPLATMQAYDFAGFEPNGSRFAFSYVGSNPNDSLPFSGGLMVVDAATGVIASNIAMRAAAIANGMSEHAVWALMETWARDGIRFADNCYGCEGRFEGQYALWQPDIGGFITNPNISFSIFGTRLDATGEFLYMAQNQAFAYDPSPGLFAVPNVIHYTPTGGIVSFMTEQNMPTAPVAYFNLDAVALDRVHWVADGQAFLVANNNGNFWDVVYRDGRVERLSFNSIGDIRVLAGTPDGWLSQFTDTNGNGAIVHHRMNNTQSTVFSMAADTTVQLIDAPELGLSLPLNPPTFPTITAPTVGVPATIDATASVRCKGFMPSRLTIGEQARVTPGASNRLRSNPSTNASIVGQIPGEGIFFVLEGPVCDEGNGIAWWRVEYQGITGWTAEGQGGDYWTEPLNR
ncbi:MAG: SH3 domain-containing protein [Anaerolineae bacterium]|nr:SH3 domain-containing protein [Anaerolineae bacterium]